MVLQALVRNNPAPPSLLCPRSPSCAGLQGARAGLCRQQAMAPCLLNYLQHQGWSLQLLFAHLPAARAPCWEPTLCSWHPDSLKPACCTEPPHIRNEWRRNSGPVPQPGVLQHRARGLSPARGAGSGAALLPPCRGSPLLAPRGAGCSPTLSAAVAPHKAEP